MTRGYTDFMDVSEWNSLTWGNIGITLGLLVVRVFYLLGAFGQDKVVKSTTKAIKDI